jgi:phosphonate metabolism protein PhnN/1,5-bisphosphokinase (PRPP-forming)
MNAPAAPPLPAIAHGERLLVVVGASGVGKDSLMRGWRAALAARGAGASPHFAQRVVTRPPDPHEGHEPATPGDFAALRAQGLLATWWSAHGLDYGVRASQLAALGQGGWVVVNGSRAHLPALRTQAPGLRVLEVVAPAALQAQRLAARAREDAAAAGARLARRVEAAVEPAFTLVNDGSLQQGVQALLRWWDALA